MIISCTSLTQGLGDGAGAMVVASEDACKIHNLEPLARLVSYQVVGCDPFMQGLGAVISTQKLLDKTGFNIDDVDLYEVPY